LFAVLHRPAAAENLFFKNHNYFEYKIIIQGQGIMEEAGENIKLSAGDLVFINNLNDSRIYGLSHDFAVIHICFKPSFLGLPDEIVSNNRLPNFTASWPRFLNSLKASSPCAYHPTARLFIN